MRAACCVSKGPSACCVGSGLQRARVWVLFGQTAQTSRQPRLGRGRQGHPVSPVPELTSHLSCRASGTWKLAPGDPVARKGNLELGPQKPFLKFSVLPVYLPDPPPMISSLLRTSQLLTIPECSLYFPPSKVLFPLFLYLKYFASEPDLDQLSFKLHLKMHIFRNDIACLSICIFLKVFINIFYYGKIDITLHLSFIHF